ncbi:MAG: hypothetical protein IJ955_10335 [Oscillospiraceae bacterium]|nr:hypothetical protein [Oscillospiraceae bacterium]
MQETSELYQQLLCTPGHYKEIALEVAGELYLEDRISFLSTYSKLFSGDQPKTGCAVARELRATLRNPGTISETARLVPMFRLRYADMASEWIRKGIYYIYTRSVNTKGNTVSIFAFDAMLHADQVWVPRQSLTFPMSMRAAVEEMAQLMSVDPDCPIELDNPDDISVARVVDYPANDWTCRNILQFIAAAHGGNFVVTDLGKLRLCRLGDCPPETFDLVDSYGRAIVVGGVRIRVG